MIKLKVVDYIIEQVDIKEPEFCCSVSAYYTFDHDVDVDDLELADMAYFNIMVGTPKGLGLYFERLAKASNEEIVFFHHIAVMQSFDKTRVMALIRKRLESITGKTEKEVIRKAMIEFDWEYQDDDVELRKLHS